MAPRDNQMTGWSTSVIECRGGLVTNISPLQQGLTATGTARNLVNFEPSIEGGYRRIKGFSKYSDTALSMYGDVVVQGSGQSGTSLVLSNILETPSVGDTFTIDGVTGVYEIQAVSYNSTSQTASLTLTSSLASSPADKAAVTFSESGDLLVKGLVVYGAGVIAARGGNVYYGEGSSWSKINTPSYGTTVVDGAAQTGGTLNVTGLTSAPLTGDTFSVDGIELVYTVTSDSILVGSDAALSISPNLDSSPSDTASITWLSSSVSSTNGKVRFCSHQFNGVDTVIGVTSGEKPFKYDGSTFTVIEGNSDTANSEFVVEFKNHIFFGKGTLLSYSQPYDDDAFDSGSGAGTVNLPHVITGLKVFRDNLIIFSTDSIHYLSGSSSEDFQLTSISKNLGCVGEDTIQEVGGDILFLGPDGLRLLSATQNIGDFGLAVASRNIQEDMLELIDSVSSFSSVVLRGKSQYRLFGYKSTTSKSSSKGVIGVQFEDQTASGMAWSLLRGFKSYVSSSEYNSSNGQEVSVFANNDGYIYRMETANDFDGSDISASYYTPFISVTDPAFRKTIYKVHTYTDPEGAVEGNLQLRFDLAKVGKIQPPQLTLSNGGASSSSFYGSAVYGSSVYSSTPDKVFENQAIGAGFTVSFEYEFSNSYPPFSIDTIIFEYLENDRQ